MSLWQKLTSWFRSGSSGETQRLLKETRKDLNEALELRIEQREFYSHWENKFANNIKHIDKLRAELRQQAKDLKELEKSYEDIAERGRQKEERGRQQQE